MAMRNSVAATGARATITAMIGNARYRSISMVSVHSAPLAKNELAVPGHR